MSAPPEGRLALALSGGGSRAIAFHLGCMKALHRVGLLEKVDVMTSVSGGSVIAALYCSFAGEFQEFEQRVRQLLERGFIWSAIRVAFTTPEGIKAISVFLPIAVDRFLAMVASRCLGLVGVSKERYSWLRRSPLIRSASRTTILRRAFDEALGRGMIRDLRQDRPELVIVACELRAKAAFYFTRDKLHCWRYGTASSQGVSLADAVVASAAYPLFLPAIDRHMEFVKAGRASTQRITLTDGGVYDNLGLAPLWPGRDPSISLDTGTIDSVIACRAGYSLEVADPSSTLFARINAVFDSAFARVENLSTNRLHDLARLGAYRRILVPYLGQRDDRLAHPPSDLVSAKEVARYPTNFSAMTPEWIEKLSRRGEQMVIALLKEHWPERLEGD